MARVLLTGGSSFTGLWIARALSEAGHEVVASLTRAAADYEGLRAERIEQLSQVATIIGEAPVASARFRGLVAEGFDLLAHHAADIPNYRSPDYEVAAGLSRNVDGVREALAAHASAGGRAVIATGTAFEAGEGGGGQPELAVSPYGLSKYLTNETVRHFARWSGLGFGKFVISGPFGAMEEGRLCWSLLQRWFQGQAGVVRTPRYIRDNIPVPLLARAYADLAARMLVADEPGDHVARPAGYVGAQGDFALKVAQEMAPRLGLECRVELMAQPELVEPRVRANDEPAFFDGWSEPAFWDDYADYYRRLAAEGRLDAPA